MLEGALDRLDAVVDELISLDLEAVTDDDVLAVARRVERARRRLAVVDHAVIGQVEARSLPFHHGARSAAVLLSNLLRISRAEASARVKAAEALGRRRTLAGELVQPRFPVVAAAQSAGDVSERHAAEIVRVVDRLPDELADQFGEFVEQTLTEQATECDPAQLRGHADALAYALDQDGQFKDVAYREKTRRFDVHRRLDGSAHVEAELTAEAAEHLVTVLDSLARPAGPDDQRTPSQRRHDGFLTGLTLLERADVLAPLNGVKTTVMLTMDADSWVRGVGSARTGHGYTIPASVAKKWAGDDCRIILTLLSKTKAVEAYSSIQRIFTEQQRLALFAIHGGCSYPDCDAPPGWCEIHHVTEHSAGGPTSVANAAPLCSYDHRHHDNDGWSCVMLPDGLPAWVPPRTWIRTRNHGATGDSARPERFGCDAAVPSCSRFEKERQGGHSAWVVPLPSPTAARFPRAPWPVIGLWPIFPGASLSFVFLAG